ncbi:MULTISPECIES: Ger(x)C family spore germination protein [unclassified Paenibacillus]|uniref:Ger(x)C family spore germination protein n=1 Tax=unclassified Paenibacillus TaxID=185978 RepID=UPI001C10D76A|nr:MULTISPECIES: Ger(x)C family spore germination protein [unclassified Paenibacillus]MBU5442962.1 Ger(x)C family spore germination protein [Paenibacillus sp. MSJ-34]CAH0119489.1 Spore germination protein A3 [Paenibacillus sp. CECT 9249]
MREKQGRAIKLLCVMLLTVPLLSGCWDRLEIEERAVVLGISVDSAEGEHEKEQEITHLRGKFPAPKQELIRVAVQIALPGKIPLGPGQAGGEKGGKETVWVLDSVGHTIDDALMNLQQQISSRLFFGHLRVIVVSREAARKGLQTLNDYLRRNSEVRRTAWMLVSEGDAKELMKAAPKLERVPTMYLLATLDEAVRMGKFPTDFLGIFWSNSSKKGKEGFLPYVKVMKEQNVEIKGIAFFKNDKLVEVTEPLEIAAYMGIKGVTQAGYRSFVRVGETPTIVMLYATSRKSYIKVDIVNGRPHFLVTIFLEDNIEEKVNDSVLLKTDEVLWEIERKNNEAATKLYEDFIKKTQNQGADILGFGEYVRAKKPQYWNRHIRTKERWQEMYPSATFEVKVHTKIRRVGMESK